MPVQALLVDEDDEGCAAQAQGGGQGRCRGVVTAAGQLLRCTTLIAGAGTLA